MPSLLFVDRLRYSPERFRAFDCSSQVEENDEQKEDNQDEEDAQDHQVSPVANHFDERLLLFVL